MALFNNDGQFATGELTSSLELPKSPLPGICVQLYYFHEIKLSPVAVFKHLTGVPLKAWLENSSFAEMPRTVDTGTAAPVPIGPLRYVHGRSEVMKGRHYISLVLLASLSGPVDELQWMSSIPSIYKDFTRLLDTSTEKST